MNITKEDAVVVRVESILLAILLVSAFTAWLGDTSPRLQAPPIVISVVPAPKDIKPKKLPLPSLPAPAAPRFEMLPELPPLVFPPQPKLMHEDPPELEKV